MTANENKTILESYGDSVEGIFLGSYVSFLGLLCFILGTPRLFPRAPRVFVLGLLGVNLGFLDFNSVAS